MKKWLIRKINRRLSNIEGHCITATERKIKRTAYWMTIAILSWGIPFTTDYTEHLVFENPSSVVSESVSPENPADILAVGTDTGDDGVQSRDESDGDALVSKIARAFPEDVETALALFKAESGLDPSKPSETDYTVDGKPFSFGLAQINLTVHKLAGTDCSKAFDGRDHHARIKDESLYEKCVKLAINPDVNIETAKGIYERSGKNFGAWGAWGNGAYLRFMN